MGRPRSTEPAEVPAWEGSLSDVPVVPAPDGHDTQKNALEPDADEETPAAEKQSDDGDE